MFCDVVFAKDTGMGSRVSLNALRFEEAYHPILELPYAHSTLGRSEHHAMRILGVLFRLTMGKK